MKRHIGGNFLKLAIGERNEKPKFTMTVRKAMEFVAEESGELLLEIDDPTTKDNTGYLKDNLEIGPSEPE